MFDFKYYNPTKVIFGKSSIDALTEECKNYNKIMLTYGGGSIKANGVFDRVKKSLGGKEIIEFGGIPANPTYEHCMKAVEIARKEGVDFLLAVGGGSVLDGTKFIACATKYTTGDPWEVVLGANISEALPLGCVMTLPATGSEMNGNSVISKKATKEKLGYGNILNYPKFSVLDPTSTYTLPPRQTANGVVDTFVHVCEQLITKDINTKVQDYQAIAILKTLISEGPKVLVSPKDYDARANLMWASTSALNGNIGVGIIQDWSSHGLGHELTAIYGLDHAVSLAIVMPRIWEYKLEAKRAKLELLGQELWSLSGVDAAEKTIVKTEEFFRSLGVNTKLSEWDIDPEDAATKLESRFKVRGSKHGEDQDLTPEVVGNILRKC